MPLSRAQHCRSPNPNVTLGEGGEMVFILVIDARAVADHPLFSELLGNCPV
jgi:hypothetical protein